MRIVQPWFKIETAIDGGEILRHIEKCARTCYKSEHRITDDIEITKKFVRGVINRGHESTIEHFNITVRFLTDRGVTHELVRHRIASFSQESTRYCSYDNDRFGNQISVIEPFVGWPDKYVESSESQREAYAIWRNACEEAERSYFKLINLGCAPQLARSVLPNSLAAEIVVTANLREWRKIFQLRTAPDAHAQMRQLMVPLLNKLNEEIPVIFEDIINKLINKGDKYG